MGRQSTIDEGRIFEAVGQQLVDAGAVRLQDIVASTGYSIGSLYHRYGSREALLAHAWLDAVEAFQARFLAHLEGGTMADGERAAVSVAQFCREERGRALILVCCRKEEFLTPELSGDLVTRINGMNQHAAREISAFAKRHQLPADACRLALVAFPLGAVRMYLPDRPVPKAIDGYIASAYRATTSHPEATEP